MPHTPAPPPDPAEHEDAPLAAMNRALDRMGAAQALTLGMFNDLLQSPQHDKDAAINRALAALGSFVACDRTYVFRTIGRNRLANTHEWVAGGIAPMIDSLQDIDLSAFDDWLPSLLAGETVQVDDVQRLPEGSVKRETLEMQGIRSLLLLPMVAGGELRGLIGYDAVRRTRHFLPGEIDILKAAASAIDAIMSEREARVTREAANAELALERARLVATLGAMPDIVVELSTDGRIVRYYSDPAMIGAEVTQALQNVPLQQVLSPQTATEAAQLLREVARTGDTRRLEFELDLGTGPRWFQANAARRLDAGGLVRGFVVVLRDITLMHWQSREVERLGEIARRTTNLVVITAPDRRITWVNRAFEDQTGLSLPEVRGQRLSEFLAKAGGDAETCSAIRAALSDGKAIRGNLPQRKPDGAEIWLDFDIQPLQGPGQDQLGFMAVLVDITALKQAEARARMDRAAAMDASFDGIALVGPDGRFQYMNKAMRDDLGLAREDDIIGRNWRSIFAPDAIAQLQGAVGVHLRRDLKWRGEIPGSAADGSSVDLELSLTLRPDGGIIAIGRNIAERRRTELDRARLRDALHIAQRREVIGQLAAGLAHDFNNLLATITGSAGLIETASQPDAPHLPHVARIAAASDQAAQLVGRLLGLGARASKPALIDLRAPLREAADLLVPGFGQGQSFVLHLPPRPALGLADPTDVVQIVLNLAINARDALPASGGAVHLRLGPLSPEARAAPLACGSLDPGRTYWRIGVQDNGAGIPPAMQTEVFRPYFSTKGDKGTGLGLAIVAGIVTANQGAIALQSPPGQGTRIDVFWPISAPPGAAPAPPGASTGATPQDLRGKKVLLVDDAPDLLQILTAMLQDAGAEVAATGWPQDAIEAFAEDPQHWDLVITDFDLPGMTGAEMAGQLRAMRPQLPIVLVTALPEWQARNGGPGCMFSAVLGKPVTRAALVAAAAQAIGAGRV